MELLQAEDEKALAATMMMLLLLSLRPSINNARRRIMPARTSSWDIVICKMHNRFL